MAEDKIEKSVESVIQEKLEEKKPPIFSSKMIGAIADEVSKTLISRLPHMLTRPSPKKRLKKATKIEYAIFLDTSAIIDGRIFDVIDIGLLNGVVVLPSSILLELKHLADSQDTVRRVRGKKGLEALEKLKKTKKLKMVVLGEDEEKEYGERMEVDEKLIKLAKRYKGKVLTCDYNLEKKALIENVAAVNINALAHLLKVRAVPGEALHVQISHKGKDITQGVGYLDDGTMIVVENGNLLIGKTVDVVVSRVIQTITGRILFAKKI